MAERRVTEIVGERQRLGEIVVEPERPGERAGDLPDLDRVRQPGAIGVAFNEDEDLRLVGEAAKCRRVQDAVAVALTIGAGRRRRLGKEPAAARLGVRRIGRASVGRAGRKHGLKAGVCGHIFAVP
jgi:hypothetical protein